MKKIILLALNMLFCLFSIAQTLQSVTDAGASTTNDIRIARVGGTRLILANYNNQSFVASVENAVSSDLALGADNLEKVRILGANGNVGIGTTSPTEKLSVNGKIRSQEIKVESGNWPDYVFTKDYQLPSLQETEKQIKETGHLSGIPSAAEVKANGIALGEMNAKLLKKIEELTLYLIEQNKLIVDQKIINQSDKSQLQLQQKQIDQLSRQLSIISNKLNF